MRGWKMNVEILVSYYKQGAYTCQELCVKVSQLISPDNVDAVMSHIPPECIQDFRDWAFRAPSHEGILFAGHVSPQEATIIEEKIRKAVPLVRDWFVKQHG